MNISSKVKDNVLVVALEGDVTLGNASEVNEFVVQKMAKDQKRVVLNLEKVEYLDSSAVGMIVAIYSTLQTEGGALRISCVSDDVMEIFKASSLDTFLNIDKTEDDSLIAIQ